MITSLKMLKGIDIVIYDGIELYKVVLDNDIFLVHPYYKIPAKSFYYSHLFNHICQSSDKYPINIFDQILSHCSLVLYTNSNNPKYKSIKRYEK